MLNLFNLQSAPTWDDPIAMLYACHGKIKKFCKQLQMLPEYVNQNGLNQPVQESIKQIIHYFQVAAPLHHADEEDDFFPTLGKYYPKSQIIMKQLAQEHQTLNQSWAILEQQLHETLQNQRPSPELNVIRAFCQAYERHMAQEELLFALGKQHIPAAQLSHIGKIMAKRRSPKSK